MIHGRADVTNKCWFVLQESDLRFPALAPGSASTNVDRCSCGITHEAYSLDIVNNSRPISLVYDRRHLKLTRGGEDQRYSEGQSANGSASLAAPTNISASSLWS